MWQNLKKKLVAIISANNLFEKVYDYEVTEFSGDPAVTITPSANESDYRTNTTNRRIYAFTVMIWVKRGEPRTDKQAEDVLTDLVDSVLDDFDRYYTLGTGSPGAALVLPTGYTMVRVRALPSTWFYANRETMYRGAEIQLQVEMEVDVNLIT